MDELATPPDLNPDRPLGRRGVLFLGLCVLAANAALVHLLVRGAPATTVEGRAFEDRFDRAEIGGNYFTTGGHWRIVDGELGSAVLRDIGAMLADPVRMLAWG